MNMDVCVCVCACVYKYVLGPHGTAREEGGQIPDRYACVHECVFVSVKMAAVYHSTHINTHTHTYTHVHTYTNTHAHT
jgi:hypothetical protein